MPLVSHLCHHVRVLGSCLNQQFRLVERACQWFLHEHVFSFGHRHHDCREMSEVGRSNCHSFNFVSHLVEHLPEILKQFRVRELCQCLLRVLSTQIHVAQGYHVSQSRLIEIVDDFPASVSNSDMGQIYFLVSANNSAIAGRIHPGGDSPQCQPSRCQCRVFDKFSSRCHTVLISVILYSNRSL